MSVMAGDVAGGTTNENRSMRIPRRMPARRAGATGHAHRRERLSYRRSTGQGGGDGRAIGGQARSMAGSRQMAGDTGVRESVASVNFVNFEKRRK